MSDDVQPHPSSTVSNHPNPPIDPDPQTSTAHQEIHPIAARPLWTKSVKGKAPVSPGRSAIAFPLEENSKLELKDLAIETSSDIDMHGLCTFHLGYAREGSLTSLEFDVLLQPAKPGARFSHLVFTVRLVDPDTGDLIKIKSYEPVDGSKQLNRVVNSTLTTVQEAQARLSASPSIGFQASRSMTSSIQENVLLVLGNTSKGGGVRWIVSETTKMSTGITNQRFKLSTTAPLPFIAEIRVRAQYEPPLWFSRTFRIPNDRETYIRYHLFEEQ